MEGEEGGDEEDVYWARAGPDSAGIVVATTWMLCKPKHFEKYGLLYISCNWDSLVSHPKILNLWFPNLARALAIRVLHKLVQELQARPRPIVFATFSGGLKSCLYKILQILDESYGEADSALTKYRIVRDCYAGQIQDSSPVDFVSRNGADFVTHPTVLGTSKRNRALTWMAHAVGKSLDFLLLPKFEVQRANMWRTVDKSGEWGPVLVLCSKDDDLAPIEVIRNFSTRLLSLGCKVTLIVFEESTHVAHLRRHPDEYISAITAFLSDAATTLSAPKLNQTCYHGCKMDDVDGSISGSATLSQIYSGQKEAPQNIKFESETSIDDGITRFWISSRM